MTTIGDSADFRPKAIAPFLALRSFLTGTVFLGPLTINIILLTLPKPFHHEGHEEHEEELFDLRLEPGTFDLEREHRLHGERRSLP
jgi:hypothetical protein